MMISQFIKIVLGYVERLVIKVGSLTFRFNNDILSKTQETFLGDSVKSFRIGLVTFSNNLRLFALTIFLRPSYVRLGDNFMGVNLLLKYFFSLVRLSDKSSTISGDRGSDFSLYTFVDGPESFCYSFKGLKRQ